MRRAVPIVAALAWLALAGAAAAAPRETVYDVTFELESSRTWSYTKTSTMECNGGTCSEEEKASGNDRLQLQTPHPERVTVMSGLPNRQKPLFMGDLEANLRLVGHHRLNGTHTDTYSGAWDAANPDVVDDTSDCGDKSVKTNLSFNWVGSSRLGLVTITSADLLREHCPWDGYVNNLRGDDGAPQPDTMDVIAGIAESKVGRVADFTIRGTRTWHGTTPPTDNESDGSSFHEHGEENLSWQWTAKFHKHKAKKKKKKRRR